MVKKLLRRSEKDKSIQATKWAESKVKLSTAEFCQYIDKKLYEEINDSLKPFFNVFKKLKDKNPIGYTKKVQTSFK